MGVIPGLGCAVMGALSGRHVLRPDSLVSAVQINSGTYASIDEVAADDADYIDGKKNIIASYRMGLSNPAGLVGSGPAYLRYRAANGNGATPSGTPFITLTLNIYEGATLRATTTQVLTAAFVSYEWSPNLSAVTNYNNLEAEIAQDAIANRNMVVSWLELDIPAG